MLRIHDKVTYRFILDTKFVSVLWCRSIVLIFIFTCIMENIYWVGVARGSTRIMLPPPLWTHPPPSAAPLRGCRRVEVVWV